LSTTWRALPIIVGALACITAGGALVARSVEITNHAVLVVAVLSPYLMLGAALGLVLFLAARRWILAGFGGALTVAVLAVQLPAYIGSDSPPAGHPVRVLTANLALGGADAQAFVGSARQRADVVAVEEFTPDERDRLSAAGMNASFPYTLLAPRESPDGSGVGLWSRYPLQETMRSGKSDGDVSFLVATTSTPGASVPLTVSVVHLPAPWPWPIDVWRDGISRLSDALQQIARSAGAGAVVVAGDFNSTPDMKQFRRLLRDGYQDGAAQDGAGFIPTFPNDPEPEEHTTPPWVPRYVITIDHVLTRGCRASAVRTAPLPGSDHLALGATIEIPDDVTP
jgi:endonuclease/exonuclease/phosphatase (EEP) superfamily protein YafD